MDAALGEQPEYFLIYTKITLLFICERSEREYPWACVYTLRSSVIYSIDFCVRVWGFTRSLILGAKNLISP
jgi:hypothetical protein